MIEAITGIIGAVVLTFVVGSYFDKKFDEIFSRLDFIEKSYVRIFLTR